MPPPQTPARRVLALAVPALGVLAAEPLYLLLDTAVVGRLGAVALAALAVGGVVLVHGAGPVVGIGLPGSAVANVVAQVLAAGLFLRTLVMELAAERVTAAPSWTAMRAQLGMGRDLVLRTSTLISALVGFLPLVWVSFVFGWGLVGIWSGLAAFMLLRLAFVLARTRGTRWAVTGAARP